MDSCVDNGKLMGEKKDILTAKELNDIVEQTTNHDFEILDHYIRPACEEGLKGFVGDHFKMTVTVKECDRVRKMHLFIKTLPLVNKPKTDFIIENQFFKREALMFNLLEEMEDMDGQNSWYSKAFIHSDKLLVMPDLCVQGYEAYPTQRYFDKEHVLATATSLARFHAAFANYVSKKTAEDCGYDFFDIYGDIVCEPPMSFCDSPWIRAAAKLSNNLLKEFSLKKHEYPTDLEEKLCKLFVKGCATLKEYKDTLNVIVHKDLWANNILFKYESGKITNAVLLDFQCIRFAPPAFDVISLLYLSTSRDFRERYGNQVLRQYYSEFKDNLNELTTRRLQDLDYDEESFLDWVEKARLFGMLVAIAIFPYALMEPSAAQKAFDNPDTYVEYLEVDRSVPVLAHARENSHYKIRQLEVCEEFVERFVSTS